MKNIITIRKAKEPFGWMGNMSAFQIEHPQGVIWRTAEALFQALRFEDETIKEAIRAEKSPMTAKFTAKAHAAEMAILPCSPQDLNNMRLVLKLKMEQHPALQQILLNTGDATIIEDCTRRRPSPWGAQLIDEKWIGENMLGLLWMELRNELKQNISQHIEEFVIQFIKEVVEILRNE